MSLKTEVDGLLLVKKPAGCTSHDVVARARRILNLKSVGHTGTLDPLASGLMVLVLGQATRLSQYLMEGRKSYKVGAKLGLRTDMLDVTGTTLETREVTPADLEDVAKVGAELEGVIQLPVPNYSAVKVGGKKLYEYAREQKDVPIVTRPMRFGPIRFLGVDGVRADFEIGCDKGGYIRSWVSELGDRLKVGAAVETLERTFVEPYSIDEAINLEDLDMSRPDGLQAPFFIPMNQLLSSWPSLKIDARWERLLLNGQIPTDVQPLIQRIMIENGHLFPNSFGVRLLSQDSGRLLSLILRDPKKTMRLGCVFPRTKAP